MIRLTSSPLQQENVVGDAIGVAIDVACDQARGGKLAAGTGAPA